MTTPPPQPHVFRTEIIKDARLPASGAECQVPTLSLPHPPIEDCASKKGECAEFPRWFGGMVQMQVTFYRTIVKKTAHGFHNGSSS
jgi:hypothetical protein